MVLRVTDRLRDWLAPVLDPLACLEAPEPESVTDSSAEALLQRLGVQLRQQSGQAFYGENRTLFRGHGMDFVNLREYMPGDDIRKIDWNVFARTLTPHVREYREEKQLTVWLVTDWTPSMFFGQRTTKAALAVQLAGLLGLLAHQDGHRLGSFCFSAEKTAILQPGSRYEHLQHVMEQQLQWLRQEQAVVTPVASSRLGDIFLELSRCIQKRSLVFVLSDFLSPAEGWLQPLGELSRKCRLCPVHLSDPVERELPGKIGLLSVFDPESRQVRWLDTDNAREHAAFIRQQAAFYAELTARLSGIGSVIPASTDQSAVDVLMALLRRPLAS